MDVFGKRQSVHLRHVDIGKTAVHPFGCQHANGFTPVAGRQDLKPFILKVLTGNIEDIFLVINEKKRFFVLFGIHDDVTPRMVDRG